MKLSSKFRPGIFGFALGEMPRAFSKTPQGQAFRRRGRASQSIGRALLVLALLVLAVGAALAGHGGQSVAASASFVAQSSTSLNGPGNLFLTAAAYGTGGTSTSFAIADFNGDGKLDLAASNSGSNNITVLLGNGDGSFQAPIATAVPCNPVWVAAGDFNGDGKQDLAVAAPGCSAGTNGVAILLGNGNGTFTVKGTLTSPLANPVSAVVGDFNGDGKADLAVVDHGASQDIVYVYLGNGDGTFQAPAAVNLGVTNTANIVVAADFNKDGKLDLAVSSVNQPAVYVILGNGNGTFHAPTVLTLPTNNGGWGLAVGDFNGDGIPDLVATTPNIGGVSVFLGKGDGTFTGVNNPQSGSLPTATAAVPFGGAQPVAVGDFNKDGKLDVIAGLSGVNGAATVAVLLGNGDGTLQPEILFGTGDNPSFVGVADFNGDGNLDWVTNANISLYAVIGLGRGDGTFLAARNFATGSGPSEADFADFNKDGKLDVVVPNSGSQTVSIFLGKGDGTFQPSMDIAFPALNPTAVAAGDFNNDGNPDFVVFSQWCPNFVNAPFFTYLGNGDGTFQAPITTTLSGLSSCAAVNNMLVGDFNKDGKLDVAIAYNHDTGNPLIQILLGKGDGTFTPLPAFSTGGVSEALLTTAPLRNTGALAGILDLILTDFRAGQVKILLGNGDGTFQAPTNIATGRFPGGVVAADFNGDGKLDILLTNELDNNLEFFSGNGDGTFNSGALINLPVGFPPANIIIAGDFNLDGKLDIAFDHAGTGRNLFNGVSYGLSAMLGNGDGTFQAPQDYLISRLAYPTPNHTASLGTTDFDGDGTPDVLLVDPENLLTVLLNQTPPPLSVLPNGLSYGNQIVGTTSATQPITVKNNSTTATTITVAVRGDFTQSNTCPVSPATLAPAASCTVNVAFKPSATGVRTGAITVSSTLPGGPQTVTLSGTGLAAVPVAMLSASNLSFNNQVVNTTSSPQTVTLTNSGGATLHLAASGAVVVSGTNASDFTVATGTTCIDGATVAPSSSCVIDVTFDPSATGARSATVTITDDASPTTQTVSLTGTGTTPTMMLSPSPVNFGNQLTGTTSGAMAITLTNSGTAALHLAASNAVAIGGTNGTDFAIAAGTTCTNGATVSASGGTCVINITFTPGANGARTGSVSVTDDATPSPQTDALSGTGVFPAVALSPASLSFGNQRVGTTSAAMTVTLTNSGTAPLHLGATNAVVTSGTNASDFAVASGTTCTNGATVNVNATCLINVTFTPGATGSRGPTTFTITDDATPTTQSFTASGTGIFPLVQLSANSINFGNQRTGTTSAAQTITVTNNGTDALHLAASNAVAISGTNASDFAVVTASTTCTNGATLAPGANCVINITFDPATTGSRMATLTITDDANPTTQTVTLNGTGVASAVILSGTSLTFSGQLITTASAAQMVTLTNSGTASLTISSIAVTGANSGDFSETNTCPASSSTLAVGANCSISVTFKPTATGNRAATVTITDDAGSSPQSVSLAGTGTDFSLGAATGANCPSGGNCSTSATISAGQTATYDLQVTPASGFNGSVALTTCSGAPGASTCTIVPTAVPPSGSTSYAFAVTMSNTSNVFVTPWMERPDSPRWPAGPIRVPVLTALLVVLLAGLAIASVREKRSFLVPALAVLLLSLAYLGGCGGGGGGPTIKPPTNATLTVTGSSGGVNRTVNLSLTVTH